MPNAVDYILFIGMGDWNTPQLEIASEKGFKSIVTNRDASALALKQSDIPIVADGQDIYSILSFLYQNHLEEAIAYVYTGTELFTSAAVIAQTLKISWHSPHSAYICENKNLMREKFEQYNIPHPTGLSSKSKMAILSSIEFNGNRKYIIKPSDNLSAQGITIVDTRNDFEDAIDHAMLHSTLKTIICEEYIEGTLHDVNGIIADDRLIRLGISDKKAGSLPYAVVVEGCSPTTLSKDDQEKVYFLFEKSCRALGLCNGPVKGDLIKDDQGNLYILEIAPRLHGPLGSLYLIPETLGINPFGELLNWQNQKSVAEHKIGTKVRRRVFATASDTKRDVAGKSRILKILQKPGKNDSRLWKSNYDVPIYIIWEGDTY